MEISYQIEQFINVQFSGFTPCYADDFTPCFTRCVILVTNWGGGEGMLGTLFTEQKTNYLFFLTKGRDKDFLKVLYGMGMYQYE